MYLQLQSVHALSDGASCLAGLRRLFYCRCRAVACGEAHHDGQTGGKAQPWYGPDSLQVFVLVNGRTCLLTGKFESNLDVPPSLHFSHTRYRKILRVANVDVESNSLEVSMHKSAQGAIPVGHILAATKQKNTFQICSDNQPHLDRGLWLRKLKVSAAFVFEGIPS